MPPNQNSTEWVQQMKVILHIHHHYHHRRQAGRAHVTHEQLFALPAVFGFIRKPRAPRASERSFFGNSIQIELNETPDNSQ